MLEDVFYEGPPSPRILIEWAFTILIPYTIVLGFIWFLIVLFNCIVTSRFDNFVPTVVLGIVSIGVLMSIYLVFLMSTYRYKITDKGVYFSGGIITKKEEFLPFHKITGISVSKNTLQLVLDIGNLNIQTKGTSDYARSEIIFEGLDDPEEPNKILEIFVHDTSYDRYYDKPMRALRDLKQKKREEALAKKRFGASEYEERSIPKLDDRIRRRVPSGRGYIGAKGAQKDETLEELLGKWKSGEISVEEYLEKKKELERKTKYSQSI